MSTKELFFQWVDQSKRIVFFSGAGVSTDSGIPDFRSASGLYRDARAEEILSHSYFKAHPAEFYRFYLEHLVFPDAQPNILHRTIAKLEQAGKSVAVVTQNIDDLHQRAGSSEVLCLHGSIRKSFCVSCGKEYLLSEVLGKAERDLPPRCSCGSVIKPHVVLFGEGLDQDVLYRSAKKISEADMLVVCGTSLVVNPAAVLVQYYRGDRFVIINRDQTPYDRVANLVLRDPLSEIFQSLHDRISE